jgi:hypothetical protein
MTWLYLDFIFKMERKNGAGHVEIRAPGSEA